MKTTGSYSDVAHNWAHNQNGSMGDMHAAGNRMFSERMAIYSYGRHFMIAKHVTNKKNVHAVLFTMDTYSNTTAKHVRITRDAVSHLTVFLVPSPDSTFNDNMRSFENRMKAALKGLAGARKPEKYIEPAKYLLKLAMAYAEFEGVKAPKVLFDLIKQAENGKYAKYLQAEAARIKAENEEREKQELADFREMVLKFRKGKGERIHKNYRHNQPEMMVDYLRYNGRKKRVETSQGVQIPVAIAKRAFGWIKLTREAGGCNGECKYKILDFEVKEVTAVDVKIGCHTIQHTEIDKFAKKMGW